MIAVYLYDTFCVSCRYFEQLRISCENDRIMAEYGQDSVCTDYYNESQDGACMKILVFAGTTEGRKVAEYLNQMNTDTCVSVATEYGGKLLDEYKNIHLLAGRMDEDEITRFLQEKEIELVVDATHPFAVLVTANIRRACERAEVRYLRCLREAEECMEELEEAPQEDEKIIFVDSVSEAVKYLKNAEGNIFISTGSKELNLYTEIEGYRDCCYARVLSVWESVKKSIELGFEGAHLIAMQGPFSKELNVAMLRQTGAKYFVTKESGKTGGFEEKYEAAMETGTVLVVVGRPREEGLSVEEVCRKIQELIQNRQEE